MSDKMLCALLLLAAIPAWLRADIYDCNGTWTNKPCEGVQPREVIPEKKSAPDLETEASKKKHSFISGLRTKLVNASKSYDVWTDISGIEESCRSDETSIEQCLTLVQNAQDHLDSRVAEAKLLEEQEKTNKLLKESQAKEKEFTQENTAVSVTQDNSIYVVEEPRKHRHEDHHIVAGDENRNREYEDPNLLAKGRQKKVFTTPRVAKGSAP